MSKKTKKEKILAAYRKKLRILETKEKIPEIEIIKTDTKKEVIDKEEEIDNTVQTPLAKYFLLDLRKSIFLITIIIALEIGLYFAKLIK